jgi:AraC family transcriptional regulator
MLWDTSRSSSTQIGGSMQVPRRIAKIFEHHRGMPPSRLRRVTDYIHSHLDENLTLDKMAELAQMSRYHFGRLFKQSTGLSPHQYLLRQRIAKAKELLADEGLSINEIGHRCGFASRAHFTTAFRKMVRTTPRKYRLARDDSWSAPDLSSYTVVL